MGEKIKVDGKEVKIKREPKVFYFVGTDGIYSAQRGQKGTKKLFLKLNLKREKGFVYYVDAEGYLSKASMKRK